MTTLALPGTSPIRLRRPSARLAVAAALSLAVAATLPSLLRTETGSTAARSSTATAVHHGASAAAIPSGLRAAIAGALGADGLTQSLRPDGGLHVGAAGNPTTSWSLVPVSVGRLGGRSVPVLHGATPTTTAGRTTYAMGPVTTWYRSSPSGIEQGYRIASRPSGQGSSIAVNAMSSGTLSPALMKSGAVALETTSGKLALTYGNLRVTDATGRLLPAHFTLAGNQLRTIIDDRGAQYPLTVDPITQQAELTPSDGGAHDGFGISVALSASGLIALVGSPGHMDGANVAEGAAYVFSGPHWGTQLELTPSDGAANDGFGTAVEMSYSGATVVVGSSDHGGHGSAYVFSGTNLGTQTELNASDAGAGDHFGGAVAVSASGGNILVGAAGHKDGANVGEGAAYLFTGTTQTSELTPSDGGANDGFGSSVALTPSGTNASVGSPGHKDGANASEGAAYLFLGATQTAELVPSDGGGNDQFGTSVAESSTGTVLVGAPNHMDGSNAAEGAAYLFNGPAQTSELTPSDGAANDHFGQAVALSTGANTDLIGAPGHKVGSNMGQGAAYVFHGTTQAAELNAADGAASDGFGGAVALSASGSVNLVGATGHQDGANAAEGAAYVFVAPPGYWEVASDGGIFSFGSAQFFGSMGGTPLNKPVVGMAATRDSGGYWEVASDGGIFSFGDAQFFGSMGGTRLNQPVVGIAPSRDSGGYWEVASDGGIFSFGDAQFFGSMGGTPLNKPVVGIAATPDGLGYWEVASDGGIFSFGDAQFFGSMGGKPLNKPVVGMSGVPDHKGYWEVATDGGIFSFGSAQFYGSMGGKPLNQPIVGIARTYTGQGYWEVASDGGIFSFGDASFLGSMGGTRLNQPVVGMAATH